MFYPTTIEIIGGGILRREEEEQQQRQTYDDNDDSCLCRSNSSSSNQHNKSVTCERIDPTSSTADAEQQEHDDDDANNIRLIVSLPKNKLIMDAEIADHSISLLMDQIDQIIIGSDEGESGDGDGGNDGDKSGEAIIDTIKISNIRFTTDGVEAFKMFLTMHIPTVKHLVLNQVLSDDIYDDDGSCCSNGNEQDSNQERIICSLIRTFQSTSLETIDLSQNVLNAPIWKELQCHTKLKRLVLDYVEIDDASMNVFNECCTYKRSLEDLYVVLVRSVGLTGVDAANALLKECTNLQYLRWVYKHGTKNAALPWSGLKEMVDSHNTAVVSSNNSSSSSSSHGDAGGDNIGSTTSSTCPLIGLTMEGARMANRDCGDRGLCGVLAKLPHLQTLKLRNLGLIDGAVHRIVHTLVQASPPLLLLDLSYNSIKSDGVTALAELNQSAIINTLQRLCLDRNRIDAEGFSTILETFARHGRRDLDVRLEGNAFDAGRAAFGFALSKLKADEELGKIRRERDQIKHELEQTRLRARQVSTKQSSMLADVSILKRERARAIEERDALMKAFTVMGSSRAVDEIQSLIERINQLEGAVFSSSQEHPADVGYRQQYQQPHRQQRQPQSVNKKVDEILMERRRLFSSPQQRPPVCRSASASSAHADNIRAQHDRLPLVRSESCQGSFSTIESSHASASSFYSSTRSMSMRSIGPLLENSNSSFHHDASAMDSPSPALSRPADGRSNTRPTAFSAETNAINRPADCSPVRITPRRAGSLGKIEHSPHSQLSQVKQSPAVPSPVSCRRLCVNGPIPLEACREEGQNPAYEDR